MNSRAQALLLIGFVGLCVWGSAFAVLLCQVFGGNQDIWWTATTMPLTLEESEHNTEIYIHNELLQHVLTEGKLVMLDDNAAFQPLDNSHVSIRINNWNAQKSRILTFALMPAILSGVCATLVITGLLDLNAHRRPNPAPEQADVQAA